jgi:hypothetical protein
MFLVSGVQTPNCIRQTVFDAVALDYEKVTVIIDATAAARPEIHLCEYSFIFHTETLLSISRYYICSWQLDMSINGLMVVLESVSCIRGLGCVC